MSTNKPTPQTAATLLTTSNEPAVDTAMEPNPLLPPMGEDSNLTRDSQRKIDLAALVTAEAAQAELFAAIDKQGNPNNAVAETPAVIDPSDQQRAALKAELLVIKGAPGNLRAGHTDPAEGKTGHGGIPALQAFLNDYFSENNCNRTRLDTDPQAMLIDGKISTANEALLAYQREKIAQGKLQPGDDDGVVGIGTLAMFKADGFDLAAAKGRAQEIRVEQLSQREEQAQLVASERAKEEAARAIAEQPINEYKAVMKLAKQQLTDGDRDKNGNRIRNDEEALKALAGTAVTGPVEQSYKVLQAKPTRELMAFLKEKEKGGLTLEEIGQIKAEAAATLASTDKLEEIRPAVLVAAVTKANDPSKER
jgi:hypothetical protein